MATAKTKTISKDLITLTMGPKEAATLYDVLTNVARSRRIYAIISALQEQSLDLLVNERGEVVTHFRNATVEKDGFDGLIYVNKAIAA